MSNEYVQRSYRQSFHSELKYFRVHIAQSDLMIGAQRLLKEEARALLQQAREYVQQEIAREPVFQSALVPLPQPAQAAELIQWMYRGAAAAGVGPMAAVAGAIARYVGEGLSPYSDEILVENGGDLYIKTLLPRTVAIFAGTSPLSMKIGVEVPAGVHGVCTSAGTIGHSLSKGNADAAMVLSPDAALSDAAATALGNMLHSEQSIQRALKAVCAFPGVEGAVAIVGSHIGACGTAKLVRL